MAEPRGPIVRVAVVDDHPVMRLGLSHLVRAAPGLELVEETACVEQLRRLDETDVVLLDWQLDECGLGGLEAVRFVVERGPRVLTFSGHATRDDILDAMAAGAAGYVLKGGGTEELVEAVRLASAGSSYISAEVASRLRAAERGEPPAEGPALTARERDVLGLLASGCTYKEVAKQLGISSGTVRKHVDNIRDKWQERRLAALVRRWSTER